MTCRLRQGTDCINGIGTGLCAAATAALGGTDICFTQLVRAIGTIESGATNQIAGFGFDGGYKALNL